MIDSNQLRRALQLPWGTADIKEGQGLPRMKEPKVAKYLGISLFQLKGLLNSNADEPYKVVHLAKPKRILAISVGRVNR
jgi:hypothetical protein